MKIVLTKENYRIIEVNNRYIVEYYTCYYNGKSKIENWLAKYYCKTMLQASNYLINKVC